MANLKVSHVHLGIDEETTLELNIGWDTEEVYIQANNGPWIKLPSPIDLEVEV